MNDRDPPGSHAVAEAHRSQAAGQELGQALAKLAGAPGRVTVASDYAAVIEALRNRTADLAFVHPVGYVLASREARARIVVKDRWHGKASFTARFFVRTDSDLRTLEGLRGRPGQAVRTGQEAHRAAAPSGSSRTREPGGARAKRRRTRERRRA